MANYPRSNATRQLQYRLTKALEALHNVKPMFASTEYELQLNDLAAYLEWCASVADAHVKEDMK